MNLVEQAKKAYLDERRAEIFYKSLARRARGRLAEKLERLARMEHGHAAFWAAFLGRRGVDPASLKVVDLGTRVKFALMRVLGIGLSIRLLELGENDAVAFYSSLLESAEVSEEEREGIRRILEEELVHEQELAEEEGALRGFLEHVRDAVLGMNDGLVEVLSVSMGLAGAYGEPRNVALGGLIVGIAGALSMGIGAYASVKAQREVREGTLRRISLAVVHAPTLFVRRLSEALKGILGEEAEEAARRMARDREALKRAVLGQLYGMQEEPPERPGISGLYTGLFYVAGAVVPLIPYFLGLGLKYAVPLSLAFAGILLSFTATIIAILGGLSMKRKVAELLLAGLGSAFLTFGIGKLASALLGVQVT